MFYFQTEIYNLRCYFSLAKIVPETESSRLPEIVA
jgi:hypothetical protein